LKINCFISRYLKASQIKNFDVKIDVNFYVKIHAVYFRYSATRYIFVSSKYLTTVSRILRNRYIVLEEERHLVLWKQAFERE